MNEVLKFGFKAVASLFVLGMGAKLGQEAIKHGEKIKNT
jgi:hypothetical protein